MLQVLLGTLGVASVVAMALPAMAVTVVFQATDIPDVTPGQNLYRYDYSLSDFPYPAQHSFAVQFDPSLYASLQTSPSPPGPLWDVVSLQPDPRLPPDGMYDARSLVASPTPLTGFRVEFVWRGEGAPGSQPFVVYDDAFAIIESGQTVPEPGRGAVLIASAILLGAARRSGRLRREQHKAERRRTTAPWIVLVTGGWSAAAGAQTVEVDNLTATQTTRVSRTVFEYTLTAEASNWGDADATLDASVVSTSPHTVVVEGDVSFGAVARGATHEGADTITLRHDRRYLFDEKTLAWTVQSTPLAKTTFELIDDAWADGLISEETALIYKVFAEFGDDRLPVAYLGRASGGFEALTLGEAELRFATLSPATQAVLAPFLAPQDISGVPLGPPPGLAQAAGSAVSPASNSAPPGPSSAFTPAAGWSGKWAIQDEIAVFWDDSAVDGEVVADFTATEVANVIWPRLTALFGHPPPGRFIEIFLDQGPQLSPDDPTSYATSHACTTNPEVHIAEQHHALTYVLAHEMMHALLYYRFPALNGCNQSTEYRWMHEATAKWAEHFVYPRSMGNREHEVAPNFPNEPALPLEFFGDKHQYGAYLWFFYLSKGKTCSTVAACAADADLPRVPATWRWTQFNSSLGAVNAGIGGNGTLLDEWPKFVLFNWNRIPHVNMPYRSYYTWDRLRHRARESTSAVAPGGFQPPRSMSLDGKIFEAYPLIHRINHLGAKYWHFDFTDDDKIRRIRLKHPYADGGEPRAKVQVIVKIRGEDWRPAEDWTGFERKTLCRDKNGADGNPSEDVEELIVVISDSEYQDRSHVLEDSTAPFRTLLEMSALGCTNWVGSVDWDAQATVDGIHMTETARATNVRFEIEVDRFSAQVFRLEGGTVEWTHHAQGNRDDGDACSGDSQGGYALDPNIGLARLEFSAVAFTNPPLAPKYNAYGFSWGEAGPADYLCIDSQPPYDPYWDPPIYGAHDLWLDFGTLFMDPLRSPELYDSQLPGNPLAGISVIIDEFFYNKIKTYTWVFNRDPNATTRFEGFQGEPED